MRIVLLFCSAFLALAIAGDTLPPGAGSALDRISADSLRGHVSFLASDLLQGRDTPSPGLDIAAEYIAAQFRRTGLEPAGDDGYFQTARFVQSTPNLSGFELLLESGKQSARVVAGSVTVNNSAAVHLERVTVFRIAFETDGQTPAAEQVRGKVVVATLPPYDAGADRILSRLVSMKPAAVVVLRHLGWPPARLREVDEVVLPLIAVRDEAFSKLCEKLPIGDTQATVSLNIAAPKTRPVALHNVAALLRGSDPALKEQFVLLTAHYDHNGMRNSGEGDRIYNGANDDASGTASVIELGAALASLEPRPKRSILFVAFFGEERGFLGSNYYIRHPLRPLANTVANINLEHLGRTDDSEGPQILRAAVTGFDYSDVGETLRRAGHLTGIEVVQHPRSSDEYFGASDNLPFARAGIPAHTVAVAFMFPDYHKAGDEWQKLDYGNMARVNRMIAGGLLLIANTPDPPKWNTANPKVEAYTKAGRELQSSGTANSAGR